MKIANYKETTYNFETILEVDEWAESHKDYVRLTEPVEVEFIELPTIDIVLPQIAAIDRKIEDERVQHTAKMQKFEDDKQKLLAIPHLPEG